MDIHDKLLIGGFLLQFIIQGVAFFTYVKFELRQLRTDMNAKMFNIEEKRSLNVQALERIYSQKIEDSRKYAKGLVEIHNSDHNAIKKEIGSMQTMLQKILELLLKK